MDPVARHLVGTTFWINEREILKETQQEICEEVEAARRQLNALDNNAREAVEKLDQQMVRFVLDRFMEALLEKYRELPSVLAYLNAIQINPSRRAVGR